MLRYAFTFLLLFAPGLSQGVEGFTPTRFKNAVVYAGQDGISYFSLEIVENIYVLSTTKDYAQYMMDTYQGWELRPEITLGGFSFKFVDNAPCAGVVAYHDSASYYFYRACGVIEQQKLNELAAEAKKALHSPDDQAGGQ